jgi:hypothetical protein
VAFDDFHSHWIGLFILLAVVAIEWLLSECVVFCHSGTRPMLEVFPTFRTKVTVDVVGRELVLPTEEPSDSSG